jgi:hypothetical protein
VTGGGGMKGKFPLPFPGLLAAFIVAMGEFELIGFRLKIPLILAVD